MFSHLSPTALCTAFIWSSVLVEAYPYGTTIRVSPGQSIQAAIDSAHGGDKIIVAAGNYTEQISISTDGITLEGRNATIFPPATFVTNTCSDLAGPGTQAGICITGTDISLQNLTEFNGEHRRVISVGRHVKDVRVKGISVSDFYGLNIAIIGAQDAIVEENILSSGSQYGILTVGSKGSDVKHNQIVSSPLYPFYFIGICMDDMSTVRVAHNDISGYFIGLCVQTDGANIRENTVHDTCIGAFVDPGNKDAELRNNNFGSVLPGCPPIPKYSSGITISGASGTVVRGNHFEGIRNGGQAAGVVLVDNDTGAVTTGADVQRNTFTDNDLDIFQDTVGVNVVKRNECTLSSPGSLCG